MSWLAAGRLRRARRGSPPRLWRAQVQRQNDQAFAAQAASVGASVTTAVRRMDDLTLAARTLLASEPELTDASSRAGTTSMGVDKRFSGVAGFGYVEIVREPAARRLPAGQARLLLPADGRRRRPGHGRDAQRAAVPGYDLCQISKLLVADARLRRSSARYVVSSGHGHEMFEVVAPVYRGGGVPVDPRRRAARAPPAGSSACSTPSRSCAPSVAGQRGVSVTLEREHAAVPENRVPTGAGAAFRTLSETLGSAVGRPLRRRPPTATPDPPDHRSRPTAAGP